MISYPSFLKEIEKLLVLVNRALGLDQAMGSLLLLPTWIDNQVATSHFWFLLAFTLIQSDFIIHGIYLGFISVTLLQVVKMEDPLAGLRQIPLAGGPLYQL